MAIFGQEYSIAPRVDHVICEHEVARVSVAFREIMPGENVEYRSNLLEFPEAVHVSVHFVIHSVDEAKIVNYLLWKHD